ncbi:flagellar hook-length control protein FliK [Pseudorhizobium endolithicum]|uniref:Flagellar hook-length control protein FliK n=1 Tax=Pseudorhizobium endolithicum TaxID=1191678 RepID=A0ABN7JZ60_9HYPH|nr:flagellar hook-length control protein FliK [Pseudorhizobium endolithicum]CAD7054887.1 flagellar hook-length control protein FliK [Pseudorhizobium endolithicum]
MMLDGLSKANPAEPALKGNGRTGKSDSEDGFSSALSRLGKEDGGSGNAKAGQNADGVDGTTEPLVDADALGARSGRMSLADGMETTRARTVRTSITQASSSIKEAQASLVAGRVRAGEMPAREQELANGDGIQEDQLDGGEASREVQAEQPGPGGASEVLSILTNGQQPWAAAANGADTTDGKTRKGDTAGPSNRIDRSSAAGQRDVSADELVDMPTDPELPAGQERVFRFSDAKGGAVAGELTQAAARDKGSEGRSGPALIENVSIMESRRFLGLAPNSNGASLLAGMTGDAGWSAAMQAGALGSDLAAGGQTGSAVHMLKLQMNPHSLGSVTATLRLIGEELHVHLTVENRAAHQQLSEDSRGMLDALKSHGFSVDQVTISISPAAEADPQKGQQNAQTGQHMAGNGERNGNAQNREQQRFAFGAELNGGTDDVGSDKATVADPVGSRSGQLYL